VPRGIKVKYNYSVRFRCNSASEVATCYGGLIWLQFNGVAQRIVMTQ
jgi:hypothetical protein